MGAKQIYETPMSLDEAIKKAQDGASKLGIPYDSNKLFSRTPKISLESHCLTLDEFMRVPEKY